MAKITQCDKVLDILKKANGEWVNGRYFGQTMMLSQYHARIKELEAKGIEIIHSDFTDEYGYKSYKIMDKRESGPGDVNLDSTSRSNVQEMPKKEEYRQQSLLRTPSLSDEV